MGFISGSGTASAAPITGWAIWGMLALAASALIPEAATAAELQVELQGLRNNRGQVHVCLTREPEYFPDCAADPNSVRRSLASAQASRFSLQVPPGEYALSVVHDENGNGRLDTFLKVPREGFGFSRNPAIRMGPPRFDEARFNLSRENSAQAVRLKYIL